MTPNALCREEELRRLKETADPELRAFTDDLLRRAKEALDGGGGDLTLLSFAYLYTGDPAYFGPARRSLLATVNEKSWIDSDYDPAAYNGYDIRTSLGTAARTVSVSLGFSVFRDLFTPEDRDTIVRAAYEKGIYDILKDWVLPGTRIHALDTMGHNFWCVIVSAAGLGAAVFRDLIPDADELLRQASEALEAWFRYPGNPMNAKPVNIDGGGYYESVNYFDYSMHEYLIFADACLRLTGRRPFDDEVILRQCAEFFLQCWYPSDGQKDYTVGFGDTDGASCWYSPLWFLRYGIDVPGLRYYLRTRNQTGADPVLEALLWDEIRHTPDAPPASLSACWPRIGWAVLRDGWEKNAVMLAVKCGDTWNHAHADCAHFILYRKGKPEICDSLTASYSDELYHTYFVDSAAHNVLLFNGHGQDFRDNYKNNTHLPGRILNFTDRDGFRYLAADGTGPMSRYFRKHHRHFLWLDGFILIYDDVECYEAGDVAFLLHALPGNTFLMLSPAEAETRTGWKHSGNETVSYTAYHTATDEEHHAKFCGIILLDEGLEPVLEDVTDGWRITAGDTVVYINRRADGKIVHRNCINVMDGIVTDAEILAVSGGRYGVVNGSIVRADGESILETLSRVNGWCDLA